MFVRVKNVGTYRYLQIAENRREGKRVKQSIIATLGRLDKLAASGAIDQLLRSAARFAERVMVLSEHSRDAHDRPDANVVSVGPALIFERLWHETGCQEVVRTVRAYKGLSVVERAFRSLKTVDLKVRPIYHYAGARVRAHVFLCMLAYYVEWHMRQRLKPLLFDDEEPDVAEAARPSVVAPAEVSPSAQDKARRKRTASGEPVHSFRTLLDDLATVANNRVVAPLADAKPFDLITRPTALQRKAFKLLGVRLERTQ